MFWIVTYLVIVVSYSVAKNTPQSFQANHLSYLSSVQWAFSVVGGLTLSGLNWFAHTQRNQLG